MQSVLLHKYITECWDVPCTTAGMSHAETNPRIARYTVIFIVSNKTKTSRRACKWVTDVKTLNVAIWLHYVVTRNQRYPTRSSCGCVTKFSICDQTVQRICFIIKLHPFCFTIKSHTNTYFLERSVPIRGQFTFFLCQSFKSIFDCKTFLVCPPL